MSNKFSIKGFPEEVSKVLEIPDMAELLMMPFFHGVSLDDFYKHGTDFHRYLVDNTNIVGKAQAGVICMVQLLYPGVAALHQRSQYQQEWHMDYDARIEEEDSVRFTHLLQSGCSECFTEFNGNPFDVDIEDSFCKTIDKSFGEFDTGVLNHYLNANESNLPLKPVQMSANRIHKFDSHIHRIVLPTRPQFRFIFRIWEHNEDKMRDINEGGMSFYSMEGKREESVNSIIRHGKDKIILDYGK